MMMIFESVPKPGRSLSGIQRAKTSEPTINVDVPMDRPLFKEIPCARTDHGALPRPD
jgi:hypothetical protein